MNYKIEKFTELDEFQLLSDKEICFLPENLVETSITSEFIYSETTTDLRKIFKKEKLIIDYLTEDKPLLRSRKSADWFGPTILLGITVLTENQHLIGLTINVISSYLYDFFKGSIGNKKIKFDIVLENQKGKEYQKITYEGDIEGVKNLVNVIKQLKK